MEKAAGGIPFDTLKFCKGIDNIINLYNTAAEYNQKQMPKDALSPTLL